MLPEVLPGTEVPAGLFSLQLRMQVWLPEVLYTQDSIDFVSDILSGCIYIVDNSTLNISLKSLGVGISSDREQRIIYL